MLERPTRRMAELIATLLQQTRAGAIVWKPTDLPGAFAYTGSNGTVVIRGPVGPILTLLQGLSIRVLDPRGDEIEQFAESVLGGGRVPELNSLFQLVVERYAEGSPLLDKLRDEVSAARA